MDEQEFSDLPQNEQPIVNFTPDSSMLAQLDSTDIILRIKDYLEGRIIDEKGKIVSEGRPIVGMKMKNSILSTLSSHINRNVVLSNLDKEEINRMMIDVMLEVIPEIAMIASKDIKQISMDKLGTVRVNIEHMIFTSLKRAEGGKERSTARTQMQDVQQRVIQDVQRKKVDDFKDFMNRRS